MLASRVFANHQTYTGSFILRDRDGQFVDRCTANHIRPMSEEVLTELASSIELAVLLEHHDLIETYRSISKMPFSYEDARSVRLPVFSGARRAVPWTQEIIDEHMEINCESYVPGLE